MTIAEQYGLVPVNIQIIQREKWLSYGGFVEINGHTFLYDIQLIYELRTLNNIDIRDLSKTITGLQIIFPLRVHNWNEKKNIIKSQSEFIFFFELIMPYLKQFGQDTEIFHFNKAIDEGRKPYIINSKCSIRKKPLLRIVTPIKIYNCIIEGEKIPTRISRIIYNKTVI